MRSSRPAPSNNNNSTQLKAKVNLAESLVSPTNSPVPSVQSTPVSSTQSSTKLRSSSSSASLAPAGRIRSPLSNDSSSFPSKYASPTPPASNAPAGPNGQPRAFLKSGVSRSALSPETTFSSSASSHPPKRTVKASITSANLISGATAYTSSSVHARSPSPTKQAPASPPKRPTPRAAVSGLAKSHLSTPPTVTPRTKSAPSLKPSTSTSSLSRLTAHAPNSPRSPIPSPTTTSTRKLSTTSSSSSGQSAQHPSLPTSSLTSPSIDLPADPNSATRSKQGTTSNGNSHSAQQQPTTTEALHQGIEKLEQAQTGLGVTLNGVLDEEDLKEIERAKEREKEARENRKVCSCPCSLTHSYHVLSLSAIHRFWTSKSPTLPS